MHGWDLGVFCTANGVVGTHKFCAFCKSTMNTENSKAAAYLDYENYITLFNCPLQSNLGYPDLETEMMIGSLRDNFHSVRNFLVKCWQDEFLTE